LKFPALLYTELSRYHWIYHDQNHAHITCRKYKLHVQPTLMNVSRRNVLDQCLEQLFGSLFRAACDQQNYEGFFILIIPKCIL
jgi:hypothetical protein